MNKHFNPNHTYNAHFIFSDGISPNYAMNIILNNAKLTSPQTLEHNAQTIIWLFQKIEKQSLKRSYHINGPIRPPAGRIGLKICWSD